MRFRFPSLDLVVAESVRTLRRFPLVLASAFLVGTTAVSISIVGATGDDWLIRLLLTGVLGLPATVAAALVAERRGGWVGPAAHAIAVLALVAFFLLWKDWGDEIAVRRTFQLSLAFHLLVACLPYLPSQEHHGFWQFNKTLFLRFLVAQLFSHVLYAGLAIALLALDKLFGVDVDEEIYLRLWMILASVFNTWYFLGGIPTRLSDLEHDLHYPKGLKVFAQYILLPIVALYLVILTAYLGKVVITTQWPSGWLGYVVSSVSVLGMLSLLLLAPIQQQQENRWVRTYSRGFYIALVPSIVMLALAIGKRIDQYGITENRYFIMVLTGWLATVSVYFIFSAKRRIQLIPISLAAVALLTVGGPWGAYATSRRSQANRLESLLERHGILVDGSLRTADARDVPVEDRREIGAALVYLAQTHGARSFPSFLDDVTTATTPEPVHRGTAGQLAQDIMAEWGIEYIATHTVFPDTDQIHFYNPRQNHQAIVVDGFDVVVPVTMIPGTVTFQEHTVEWTLNEPASTVDFTLDGAPLLVLDLEEYRGRDLQGAPDETAEPRVHAGQADGAVWKLVVQSVAGRWADGRLSLWTLHGDLYIRFTP